MVLALVAQKAWAQGWGEREVSVAVLQKAASSAVAGLVAGRKD